MHKRILEFLEKNKVIYCKQFGFRAKHSTDHAILSITDLIQHAIGPLQDPVTWYGINYAGTHVTQWDFQNKGTRTSPARLSFVLEVPLCNLGPSVINSVPCDRILQRVY